ncbi:DUF5988 family protein [Nocardia sp. NPDC051052]|uniref:DUF5988 family protein n=1 Tax=Nocardia sp. NPDC051052 TaxID=3364322 RepID=UPI0037932EF0
MIDIVLVGGPSAEPQLWHIDAATASDSVKVPRLSGYEHFDPTGFDVELDGRHLPVYLWSFRTRAAE